MGDFEKFAVHLRDEWVPSTSNNAERYFSHTKSTQVKRRFRTHEGVQSSLKTQMTVRTVICVFKDDWTPSFVRNRRFTCVDFVWLK
jgi:hypothetical protein